MGVPGPTAIAPDPGSDESHASESPGNACLAPGSSAPTPECAFFPFILSVAPGNSGRTELVSTSPLCGRSKVTSGQCGSPRWGQGAGQPLSKHLMQHHPPGLSGSLRRAMSTAPATGPKLSTLSGGPALHGCPVRPVSVCHTQHHRKGAALQAGGDSLLHSRPRRPGSGSEPSC